MSPQQRAEIVRLARERKIIDAVKIYREATGASLRDSKQAVDAIAGGASIEEVAPPGSCSPPSQEDVRELLRNGGTKIEAIKLYRDVTGAGLKEAKEAVEAMEKEVRAQVPGKPGVQKTGCFGLVLGVGFAALLWLWL